MQNLVENLHLYIEPILFPTVTEVSTMFVAHPTATVNAHVGGYHPAVISQRFDPPKLTADDGSIMPTPVLPPLNQQPR